MLKIQLVFCLLSLKGDYFSIVLLSLLIVFLVGGITTIILLYKYYNSPFEYPYLTIKLDVSGKRKVLFVDLLDQYLIDNGIDEFVNHLKCLEDWEKTCQIEIDKSLFKKQRMKQFMQCLDINHIYRFELIRKQTRYRQANYVRQPYSVYQICDSYSVDICYIKDRYEKLREIGFQATLSAYHSRSQRSLMTEELREKIKKRDNYTCQMCGKEMRDGVGLQIDHIVPIRKGGKTIESNLQVLCSKCNGAKGDKV